MKKNKLVIGFVFDDSLDRTDGVQQYIKTVGAWLIEQGHDVRFLVGETKQGPYPKRTVSLAKNFTVRGNKNRLSIPLPANKQKIKNTLAKHNFDVLHVQAPYNPLMAGRVIAAKPRQTKLVGTFHIAAEDRLTKLGASFMGAVQQNSLKQFDQIISVSRAAQNFAKQHYQIESDIIPNTIQFTKVTTLVNKSDTEIVFLGRLVERKGCRQLLQAFAKIPDKYTLKICGDGPQRTELEHLANQLGIDKRVTFLGRVSEKDKFKHLAESALAVFPATGGESFGIVLLEAMSVGTLTLGGNNPGYRTVLEDQEDHLLIDPNTTNAFAKRITKLLEDRSLRKDLIDWQNVHVKQFDIENVGPKIVELYTKA